MNRNKGLLFSNGIFYLFCEQRNRNKLQGVCVGKHNSVYDWYRDNAVVDATYYKLYTDIFQEL